MNNSRRNALPPSLVANLQQVLTSRKHVDEEVEQQQQQQQQQPSESGNELTQSTEQNQRESEQEEVPCSSTFPVGGDDEVEFDSEEMSSKPVILVTNGDGIESPGLVSLVDAFVRDGRFDVHVCAPQFDKSASGHSLTVRESVEVTSAEMSGATAFEVSGTPADCVSLALSQALFSWSKPLMVLSGINRGSSCGQNMLYSGAIAGSREALIHGVPSICISLDWKKDVSSDNDFKDAVEICLPLLNATIRDIENGSFPKGCFLNVEVPVSPSSNKGFRLTRQSLWRSSLSWRAISSYKHPSAMNIMASQQSLGIQLAQLGRDASAAGAARRLNTNRKTVEVESVGVAGKPKTNQTIRKHYRLEFLDEEKEDADDELDFKALQNGFVSVTPLALSSDLHTEIHLSVSNWLSSVLAEER
ncbi:hypothetical protein SOVF_180840 [Spinacia oleracea]|uniref:Survival protein SurE-like phosphatase/nucleotidase domain-containing protein n=1 Tax=Spinacia oleracea TaxID=3562 RepID=A0ABM3R9X0_SPIOL|nr:uncharacterized protein LOC110797735 [Spinacia oleracea]KNA06463.1 hypothetical protein SOVF_180840 [Spinacia oleracea]